jgi:signal peptidase II
VNPKRRPVRWLYLSAALVLLLDFATKAFARAALQGHAPIDLIPNVVRLSYTTNTGGAFGLLDEVPWLFAAATIAVSVAIVWMSPRIHKPFTAVAVGMILGGALGNLADRLSGGLSLDGRVTDFIDFRIWPVFNVADAAIVIGAFLLVIGSMRKDRSDEPEPEPASGATSPTASSPSPTPEPASGSADEAD